MTELIEIFFFTVLMLNRNRENNWHKVKCADRLDISYLLLKKILEMRKRPI